MVDWNKQIKFFFALVSLHFVFHQFLQFATLNVRHSLFYHPNMEEVKRTNDARVAYGERVLRRLHNQSNKSNKFRTRSLARDQVNKVNGTDDGDGHDRRSSNEINKGKKYENVDMADRFCVGVVGTEVRLSHR